MNTRRIMETFEHHTGRFPRAAVQVAMRHPDEITPQLLAVLERAVEDIEAIDDDPGYMAHFYAFYLLAQFREERAYPLIVDFFSIPGEITLDVTGDFVTEDLGKVLASVSGGDIEPMKTLVENPAVNEFVRGAAMDGMLTLVVEGVRTREEIQAYFGELFHGGLSRDDAFVWSALVSRATDLYPEELMDEIRQAFAEDLVDEMFIDLDWVKETLAGGKAAALERLRENTHLHFVEDTVEEMQWWASFEPPVKSASDLHWMAPKSKMQPTPAPRMKKVGPNDPCPCGSGRKYKHCHGKRT
ncbi:MAG: DUF1186 domain-containing protein [Anaerolineae bacterium]